METNQPALIAKSKMESLKSILGADSIQAQFKNALAENAPAFMASIIDLFGGDPYLQNCDPAQVVMQALKAAVLKLPINKSLGFAYIVPFNESFKDAQGQWQKRQVPQFQLGYKGYIQLALRTNQYRIINADVVYQGQLVKTNKLTGEFNFDGPIQSETIIGYFAHLELNGGFSKTLYMTKEKVLAHAKKYSKSFEQANGPWSKEFDAMAMKTVIRNLFSHYGYLSVEMQSAFDNDNDETAERVQSEIENHGNKQSMTFENAEVLTDGPGAPEMKF
jgi:recombination protein RecT